MHVRVRVIVPVPHRTEQALHGPNPDIRDGAITKKIFFNFSQHYNAILYLSTL